MEYQRIKKANKLLFIDSEAVVSQYYAKVYFGEEMEFIEGAIEAQDYDLYIYLEPDVKWVDDGYRTFSDPEVREKTNNILKKMFYDRGIEYRSEEHTSELQSRGHLVCRLLLEKKNITRIS